MSPRAPTLSAASRARQAGERLAHQLVGSIEHAARPTVEHDEHDPCGEFTLPVASLVVRSCVRDGMRYGKLAESELSHRLALLVLSGEYRWSGEPPLALGLPMRSYTLVSARWGVEIRVIDARVVDDVAAA